MFLTIGAAVALVTSTATVAPTAGIAEPNPKSMSQAEIRAFNASLEKGHKFYIRCKRSAATGSYVQREVSCRTNEQWAAADARGNQEARDIGEKMAGKAVNSN